VTAGDVVGLTTILVCGLSLFVIWLGGRDQ
jgi:hypothetical protein